MDKWEITKRILTNLLLARPERSITDIANKTGIERSTVSMWFSGRRQISVAHLMSLAEAYELSVDYLLYGDGRFLLQKLLRGEEIL